MDFHFTEGLYSSGYVLDSAQPVMHMWQTAQRAPDMQWHCAERTASFRILRTINRIRVTWPWLGAVVHQSALYGRAV